MALNCLRVPLLSGHLELEPAERTGPGILLPGLLCGSVLQCDQNAVGAFLLFPDTPANSTQAGALPVLFLLWEPQTSAPAEKEEIPQAGGD